MLRNTLTADSLQKAFIQLLKEKKIHEITVRELCLKAGVNRTTFYNHYSSTYDLLTDISDSFLDSIDRRLQGIEKYSLLNRITAVMNYLMDNRELAVLLLNNNVDPDFINRLFDLPGINRLLEMFLPADLPEAKKKATVTFAIYGAYRLLQQWINDENAILSQKEAELILELAERVCQVEC